jgi:hypothetical protein
MSVKTAANPLPGNRRVLENTHAAVENVIMNTEEFIDEEKCSIY